MNHSHDINKIELIPSVTTAYEGGVIALIGIILILLFVGLV